MQPRSRSAISTALSLALHTLILLWVMGVTVSQPNISEPPPLPVRIIDPRPQVKAPKVAKPPPQVAKVEPPAAVQEPPPEAPPEPKPEAQPEKKLPLPEQIVSPPDAAPNVAPPDTRFKSDRDVTVDKQQVKRGEPKPGESAPGESAASDKPKPPPKPQAPKPPQPKPQAKPPAKPAAPGRQKPPQVAALKNLDLLPNALKLAQEGYGQPAEEPVPQEERVERRLTRGGADGLFIPTGPTGTLDYLPDIRDGDITLLNTKADMFAPFVRRVAVRVFQNMLITLKKDLGNANLSTLENVEAEAVMSPSGEMLGYSVTKRSTRVALSLDRRLQQACTVGFFDRNPPPGARAQDGNIHFVFVATFEAQPTPRGLAYAVMLGTGLL
jgi:hypothetical protein